jgi:chromosome segregation protein
VTTTHQPAPLEPSADPPAAVLDGLTLHSVQLIRITRHTSHILPFGGPGVHVITGQGPRGASNGAGKTNIAASVLLTCADRQWTRSNAGSKAVGLLFSERDAQQPVGSHGDAPHGYVITVWLDRAAPAGTAVTVLMRIHRTHRDHLQVRTRPGVWFAVGGTEAEHLLDADHQWDELRGEPTYGPTQFGAVLFGPAPGSVGYVGKRGADDSGDTGLLSIVDGRRFAPRDLATELIDLCGVADQIAHEQHHRKRHAELADELLKAESDHRQKSIMEDQEKTDIEGRAKARQHRDQTEKAWLGYLAAGLRTFTERAEIGRERQERRRRDLDDKLRQHAECERIRRHDTEAAAASRV